MNPTSFPNLDLPLVDLDTGRINKGWYQLLASMYLLLGGTSPVSTPDLAVISGLMDENFAAAIEIEKGLDALATGQAQGESVARLAELSRRIEEIGYQVSQQENLAALTAELMKVITDAQAVINLHASAEARVAELGKRLNDLELTAAFSHPSQAASALNGRTVTTAPAAGSGAALPATPAGYLTLSINGKAQQLPYY